MKLIFLSIGILLMLGCTKDSISPINDSDQDGYSKGKLKSMNMDVVGFQQDISFEYYNDKVIEIEQGTDYQIIRNHIFNDSSLQKIIFSSDNPGFMIDSTTFTYKENMIERFDFLIDQDTIYSNYHLSGDKFTYSLHYYHYNYEEQPYLDSCLYKWNNNGQLADFTEYSFGEGNLINVFKMVFTYTDINNPVFRTNIADIQTMYKYSFGGYDFMDFNQNCVDKLVDEIKMYNDDELTYTLKFNYEANSMNYPTSLRLMFYKNDELTTYYDYKFNYFN